MALDKPILVINGGGRESAAHAAASHTGAFTGSDAVLHAAFRRVGILRINDLGDIFHMTEVLARQPHPSGSHLAIATNAGGLGTSDLRESALSITIREMGRIAEHPGGDAVRPEIIGVGRLIQPQLGNQDEVASVEIGGTASGLLRQNPLALAPSDAHRPNGIMCFRTRDSERWPAGLASSKKDESIR